MEKELQELRGYFNSSFFIGRLVLKHFHGIKMNIRFEDWKAINEYEKNVSKANFKLQDLKNIP